jgi:hypothetical protein
VTDDDHQATCRFLGNLFKLIENQPSMRWRHQERIKILRWKKKENMKDF